MARAGNWRFVLLILVMPSHPKFFPSLPPHDAVTEHLVIGMWECLEREEWVEWWKLSVLTIYVMSVAEFEGSALVVILVLV